MEVEQALKQMKAITAPSLDGMSSLFVIAFVLVPTLSILNLGVRPPNINQTILSLLPKIKSPEKAKDFLTYQLLQCHLQTHL